MKRPEQQLQRAIIELADLTKMPLEKKERAYWPDPIRKSMLGDWLHFTPNGGYLTAAQRGIFKAMGLRPGVFDLCLRVSCSWMLGGQVARCGGMWIECKSTTGRLSPAQGGFSESIGWMDYSQYEVRTIEEWQTAISGYFAGARPLNHDWSKYP